MDAKQGEAMMETKECSLIFQSLINSQKNLIVLLYKNSPLFCNKAFQHFFDFSSLKDFMREYGGLHDRFVPHDAYFHAGKAESVEAWPQALMTLPEEERIVSMLNYRAEPHAFAVNVDTPVTDYAIVSFTDISQELIKRIMIENDVSIDKESGAYNKEYFIHTAKSFYDAAAFNKKPVGITMIEMIDNDEKAVRCIHDFASSIKSNIRQSDMLVRWGRKGFLLAYLTDSPEHALKFSRKLLQEVCSDPYEHLCEIPMRLNATVQKNSEEIAVMIARAERQLKQAAPGSTTLI